MSKLGSLSFLRFVSQSGSYRVISPDLTKAAVICVTGGQNAHDGRLLIYSLKDGSKVFDLEKEDPDYYIFSPQWSPDGRWLSFFVGYIGDTQNIFTGSDDSGLYLLDTTCLPEPENCARKWRGPFRASVHPWSFSWSPDSRSIAMISKEISGSLLILDVPSGTFRTLKATGEDGGLDVAPVAWSADGEWIAYPRNGDIFVMHPTGGRATPLVNESRDDLIVGWITIPWPMKIGNEYKITQAGARLNLWSAPSISSKTERRLEPGERVFLLEGPIGAEGYRWWKLRVVGDGTEGWAMEHPDWYQPINDVNPAIVSRTAIIPFPKKTEDTIEKILPRLLNDGKCIGSLVMKLR